MTPAILHQLLQTGHSLALIDVREHGEYNAAHIPGASSLPRRLIEFRLPRLVPWVGAQVILCDDDGRRAALSAETLARMGYQRVAVLDGGLNAWASAGLLTEWGMNVPSKEFGERIEVQHRVPTIEADAMAGRLERGERMLILDTRTPEEYGQFCIPGGRSVPGGELTLRITDILAEDPESTVVVNCAGRTRSIIGARALQRMGIARVVSLKNGTSGWVLAGRQLEPGARRTTLPEPSVVGLQAAEAFAHRLAAEDDVPLIGVDALRTIIGRANRTCVYLVDVRTAAEYAGGHIPGFWWFPGGQAVQRADDLVAARDATIVFCCDGVARATVTASWFRQMGFPSVCAVDGGTRAWLAAGEMLEAGGEPPEPFGWREAATRVRMYTPSDLLPLLGQDDGPLFLFVDTSRQFAEGHLPGARWLSRSWLELRIGELATEHERPIVVTDTDGWSAPLAAATLAELGYSDVATLAGGMKAWRHAGLSVDEGLSGVMRPPDDVVPAGPERSHADMVQYLRWEEALGLKYGR